MGSHLRFRFLSLRQSVRSSLRTFRFTDAPPCAPPYGAKCEPRQNKETEGQNTLPPYFRTRRGREPHLQPKTAPKSPHIPRFPAERPTLSDNPVPRDFKECGELTAFFPFICFPQLPATAPCRRLRPDSGIIAEAVEIIGVHPSVPLSAKKARTHEQPQRSASRALHGSHPYAQARSDNRCRSMTRGSDKSHTVHKPIIIAITVASLPLA